jgi:hypothetical protein
MITAHHGKRSIGKLEAQKTRTYAIKHSVRKRINPYTHLSERVYTDTPNNLKKAVLSELQGERTGLIPEVPQGTVIINIFGVNQLSDEILGVPTNV